MSDYVVTSRGKVHRAGCSTARRIAFPAAWFPQTAKRTDTACLVCLGDLPTGSEPTPLDVECSMCGAVVGEDCRGPGSGYHLSRFDRFDGDLTDEPAPTTRPHDAEETAK